MEISFFARDGIAVAVPGQSRPSGEEGSPYTSGPPARYVGREFVAPVGLRRKGGQLVCDTPAKYIASSTPFKCDSESRVGRRLVRQMTRPRCRRKGEYPLWPADKATADFLGIQFVPVEIVNGTAVPKTQAEKKASR